MTEEEIRKSAINVANYCWNHHKSCKGCMFLKDGCGCMFKFYQSGPWRVMMDLGKENEHFKEETYNKDEEKSEYLRNVCNEKLMETTND